jgi:hypothetical protein
MFLKMSGLGMRSAVSLQVVGFSPVITIFHLFSGIFHPIVQL